MIHYTCDRCKRELESDELRYAVRIEVSAAFDPRPGDEADDDRDHLLEIQEILEQLENSSADDVSDEIHQELRYDLCPDCCRKLRKNPLGREPAKQLQFSPN